MGFDGFDPGGHDVFQLRVAQRKRFHLQTRHGQAIRDPLRRKRAVNIVGKPFKTYQHWSSLAASRRGQRLPKGSASDKAAKMIIPTPGRQRRQRWESEILSLWTARI